MSTSSTSATSGSTLFTGSSQFSSSLEQVIQNAVSLASLPLQQMQSDLSTLQSQSSEFSTLSTDFNNVQSAVSAIDSALGSASYTASSTDSSVATASLTGTPSVSSFDITVTKLGAYATSMSNDSLPAVSDPTSGNISNATSYTLSVGTAGYTITPSSNTLSGLADAINQSGEAQATVVNIGPPSAPDYRLYLTGNQLGDLPLQLTADNGTNPGETLLTAQTQGAETEYQVNGQPSTPISTDSPTVTIEPGVSVTLQGAGDTTISISNSTAALTSAFSQLVTAYNSAMTDLNANHGTSGGALTGQSIVLTLSTALRNLVGYTDGNSGISNLTTLGFSLDQNGVLSFDPTTFAQATQNNLTQLNDFLGSTGGGGFLGSANAALDSITDSSTGLLPNSISTLQGEITSENTDISNEEDSINTLQTNLTNQMAAADSSIASLEQQQIYLQSLFSQMQTDSETIANG